VADVTIFRHKPIEVEGIQALEILRAAGNGTAGLLPKWVQDAIFKHRIELSPQAYAVIVHPLPMMDRVGAARDWILHDPTDDTLNICPPETLEQLYDVVDS
jgi:hypothetical protein